MHSKEYVSHETAEKLDALSNRISDSQIGAFARSHGFYSHLQRIYNWLFFHTMHKSQSIQLGNASVRYYVDSLSTHWRFTQLMDEEDVMDDLLSNLRSDDVFYDIGANTGVYSCYVSGCLDTGSVIAFEPHPDNLILLKRNLGMNESSYRVCEYALSDEEGRGNLSLETSSEDGGKYSLSAAGHVESVSIPVIRGDELVRRKHLPEPDIIKIDVEGAEMNVANGLRETLLQSNCRHVYCEIHPEKMTQFGTHPEQLTQYMSDLGFENLLLHERGDEYFVRFSRPATSR